MLTANNPAIGLLTRRFLWRMVAQDDLDEPAALLVEHALDKTRPRSHCGWVYLLAEALGAPRDRALEVASFVELCSAAIDLIDDVEDGDASSYLGGIPQREQINLVAHLIALCAYAGGLVEQRFPPERGQGLVAEAFRLFSGMASGQRLELTRECWSTVSYERMSHLTGGRQFELYFRAVAYAAAIDVVPFLGLTNPLGVLVQIALDRRTGDERLLCLPEMEIQELRTKLLGELHLGAARVPVGAIPIVSCLVEFAETGKVDNLHGAGSRLGEATDSGRSG